MTKDSPPALDEVLALPANATPEVKLIYGLAFISAAEERQRKLLEDLRNVAAKHGLYVGNPSEDLDTRPTIERGHVFRRYGFYDESQPEEYHHILRRTRIPLVARLTLETDLLNGTSGSLAAIQPGTMRYSGNFPNQHTELSASIKRFKALIIDLEKLVGPIKEASIRLCGAEKHVTFLDKNRQSYMTCDDPDYNGSTEEPLYFS